MSITLTAWSFHVQNVAADWMVMPFSRSRSMLSIVAPTPSLPRTWATRVVNHSSAPCSALLRRTLRTHLVDGFDTARVEQHSLGQRGLAAAEPGSGAVRAARGTAHVDSHLSMCALIPMLRVRAIACVQRSGAGGKSTLGTQ